jgi:hypothetical protein
VIERSPPEADDVLNILETFSEGLINRLVSDVRNRLAQLEPGGVFPQTICRHVWDEYCWSVQEGPFDTPEWFGGRNFGSVDDAMNDLIGTFVGAACADLGIQDRRLLEVARDVLPARPKRMRLIGLDDCDQVTTDAEENPEADHEQGDDESLEHYLFEEVADRLSSLASRSNIALLGPDRAENLPYEISWPSGWISDALDDMRGDLVQQHADALLGADDDASDLIDAITEEVWKVLVDNASDMNIVSDFFDDHEQEIRQLLKGLATSFVEELRAEAQSMLD